MGDILSRSGALPVTFNFANSTFIYKFQYKNKLRLRNDSVRAALGDFSEFRFYLFADRREQGRVPFKLSNKSGVLFFVRSLIENNWTLYIFFRLNGRYIVCSYGYITFFWVIVSVYL